MYLKEVTLNKLVFLASEPFIGFQVAVVDTGLATLPETQFQYIPIGSEQQGRLERGSNERPVPTRHQEAIPDQPWQRSGQQLRDPGAGKARDQDGHL